MDGDRQPPAMDPQAQAMAQALQGLQQQVAHMQQQQGAQRMNLKIPVFEGQSAQEYERWVRAARVICRGNQYTLEQTIVAIISAMTGRASDIASTLSTDPASYTHVEDFFTQLKSLFVTPAFREVARAQFQSRVQGPQEPIRVYHAMLHKVWIDAYGQEEEPWRTDPDMPAPPGARREDPPGHRSRRLIEAFMQGLRQYQVRIKIRDSITFGMPIHTYNEALVRALAFLSNQERARQEGERMQHATTGASRFAWDQPALVRGAKAADVPEPMDIGGVWCRVHKTAAHSNQECRAQKGSMRAPAGTTEPKRGFQARGGPKSTDVCRACKKQGHWARSCPQRPQKYVGTIRPTETSSVPEDEEDWDEEDDTALGQDYGRGWGQTEETGN